MERLATARHDLAGALLDQNTRAVLAGLIERLPPGNGVDVALHATADGVGLPVELLRLTSATGVDLGALCLRPGVTLRRVVAGAPLTRPVTFPGPLKMLAAVAAPEETTTMSAPLDVEAEMQAVLDAATPLTNVGDQARGVAQVQILEVASPSQIGAALRADAYHHVLHLSAHGSATAVELEDEELRCHPVLVGSAAANRTRMSRVAWWAVAAAVRSPAAGNGRLTVSSAVVAGDLDHHHHCARPRIGMTERLYPTHGRRPPTVAVIATRPRGLVAGPSDHARG
jgi:hypothetical protein